MAASLRKARPVSDPYETWTNGSWEWRVLKFYKTRENTLADPYARVFCEVTGWETEMGDVYYKEITDNAMLVHTNYGE